MKTGIFGAVCLLVLTFTIAECGLSQEKRQTGCTPAADSNLQRCITRLEEFVTSQTTPDDTFCNECGDELIDYVERCPQSESVLQTYREPFNRACGADSGATAMAGATIFSTILVAVSSAMN